MPFSNKKIFNQWLRERNEVLRSMDIDRYKAFYIKWLKRGVYSEPMPKSDTVVMASLCKAILMWQGSDESLRQRATTWLLLHGFSTEVL